LTREQTAEWVGYYFGLQRASNLQVNVGGTGGADAINRLRSTLDAEMKDVAEKLPAGAIDHWPYI